MAELPVHKKGHNTFECGAPDTVVYQGGPAKIRYNARPLLTCGMALAFSRFEQMVQEEAERAFGKRVARLRHVGTYNCREMARYPGWVSEHSYANAIDIKEFTLSDGSAVNVLRHFRSTHPGHERQRRFLQRLSRRLYNENVFSVVLTPAFDELHKDHFHLDLARYRADGAATIALE